MTYLPLMAREDIPPCHTEEAALTVDTHNGLSGRWRKEADDLDRHGQGERGQYGEGTEFSVDGFVEPFQLPSVTRHPS
jgi:hypothetical protein